MAPDYFALFASHNPNKRSAVQERCYFVILGNASSERLKIQNLRIFPPVLLHFGQHHNEGLAQLQLPSMFVSEIMVIPVCVQFFYAKGALSQACAQIWKNKPMEAGEQLKITKRMRLSWVEGTEGAAQPSPERSLLLPCVPLLRKSAPSPSGHPCKLFHLYKFLKKGFLCLSWLGKKPSAKGNRSGDAFFPAS